METVDADESDGDREDVISLARLTAEIDEDSEEERDQEE